MAKHIYLALNCKTPGCRTMNLVKYIGPDSGQSDIMANPPTGFVFECGRCGRSHPYQIDDLFPTKTDSAPPMGFESPF